MFCLSCKSLKYRLLMLLFGIVLIFLIALALHGNTRRVAVSGNIYPSGETQEDRLHFLEQYGWIVREDPVSVQEILIPVQFGDVYNNYNEIQRSQGFDLMPYAGRSVKKWVYAVTNYPGYAQSESIVQATLLVCQGIIIGGDISSVELDGFMHGFDYLASH